MTMRLRYLRLPCCMSPGPSDAQYSGGGLWVFISTDHTFISCSPEPSARKAPHFRGIGTIVTACVHGGFRTSGKNYPSRSAERYCHFTARRRRNRERVLDAARVGPYNLDTACRIQRRGIKLEIPDTLDNMCELEYPTYTMSGRCCTSSIRAIGPTPKPRVAAESRTARPRSSVSLLTSSPPRVHAFDVVRH